MQKLLTILLTTCLTIATHAAANGIDGELLVKVGTTGNKAIPTSQTTNVTISATSRVTDGASAVAFSLNSSNVLSTSGAKLLTVGNGGTNVTLLSANGSLGIGKTAFTSWSDPIGIGQAIYIASDIAQGEEGWVEIGGSAIDNANFSTENYFDLSASRTFAEFILVANAPTANNVITLNTRDSAPKLNIQVAGTETTWLRPAAAAGSVSYKYDTSLTHTNGNHTEFKNNTTNIATIAYNGSLTVHDIVGVTDASNAPAGSVGEYVSSIIPSASAVALVDATAKNITSISLTAGDWDVEGLVTFITTGTTPGVGHYLYAVANTTSATISANGDETLIAPYSLVTAAGSVTLTLTRKRINVSSTTTVYLVGFADFNTGTWTANGAITARRVR